MIDTLLAIKDEKTNTPIWVKSSNLIVGKNGETLKDVMEEHDRILKENQELKVAMNNILQALEKQQKQIDILKVEVL